MFFNSCSSLFFLSLFKKPHFTFHEMMYKLFVGEFWKRMVYANSFSAEMRQVMVASLLQVSAKIRGAMRQRGYNQKDIAERLEMGQSTLSRKLAGKAPFESEEIAKLSAILEKPEFLEIAKELGHGDSSYIDEKVSKEEALLASKALQEVITRLPLREQRLFYLLTAMILHGLSPDAAAKESRFLRSLSRVDTAE